MKKEDKFKEISTRRIVYVAGKYKEINSGKTVVRYRHPGLKNRNQCGALYMTDFLKNYTAVNP